MIIDANVVAPGISLAIIGKLDSVINDQKQRLLKKNAASRKYINTTNLIYINYICKIILEFCSHISQIFAKRLFSLYNFGCLFRNGSVGKI